MSDRKTSWPWSGLRIAAVAAVAGLCMVLLAGSMGLAKVYKYRRGDGVWVFTDNPSDLPAEARALAGEPPDRTPAGLPDLAARLAAAMHPRTPIEQAVLATVAVKSGVGFGSGFFLTGNGLILTNKHVIRTPEQAHEMRATRGERIEDQAAAIESRLEAEQRRLNAAVADLERYRSRIREADYTLNRRSLDRWQQDLNRRRSEVETQLRTFRGQMAEAEARDRLNDLDRVFTVRLADNTELSAYLVAVSDELDLALLKIDGHKTPRLAAAPRGQTAVGGRVYAIGNPVALRNSVTQGVLSGYEGGLIKTDAKIYPGNSGGPLVNEAGRVLGVNTFKKLTYRFEGLGFAIPIQAAYDAFARHLPRGTP